MQRYEIIPKGILTIGIFFVFLSFSAAILLLCLVLGMPYGYFILVRLQATVAFSVMAYQYFMRRRGGMMWTLITLALLFQPFAKVGLGRTIWNVIDVVVAIG